MDISQMIINYGIMGLILTIAIWFIVVCIFGMIMKHFIREAIKEALEETGLSKRKIDETW